MDANPIDIHRATDAVLVQLDALAESNPNLLFIATSNFSGSIDQAFVSRCDLVVEVPLPNSEARASIIKDCLDGLAVAYPPIGQLKNDAEFAACVSAFDGLDGRAIRKSIANALAANPAVALKPETVSIENIKNAATNAVAVRSRGGTKE
jgi:AAA+ superfamily predicted ATPase